MYELNGQRQEAQNKFSVRMRERGFDKKRTKAGMVWLGIKLRDGDGDPTPDEPEGAPPTPPENRIDKPESARDGDEGVGYEGDFRLSARNPTRDYVVNGETGTKPYTPTPHKPEVEG